MKRRYLLGSLGLLSLPIHKLMAQEISSARPVKIIVPFAAGGSTDILARYVAQLLTLGLGQAVVVENRPGASGDIGAEAVVRSTPDGSTLLFTSNNVLMSPAVSESLRYDVVKDLTPITMLAFAPMVLLKGPSVAASTLPALLSDIRAKPGQYTFSSSGKGGAPHLAGEMLRISQGLNMVHVPYNGAAPALTDVAAGHVSITFTTYISARPLVTAKKLTPIAVASATRSTALPEVPTFAESGISGMDIGSSFCLFAPAGLPTNTVQKIYAILEKAKDTPEFQAAIRNTGSEVVVSDPKKFAAHVPEEVAFWKSVVKNIGGLK